MSTTKESVQSVCPEFGDARFHFYHICLMPSEPKHDGEARHSHRYYEIHLALRGSYTYQIDGKAILLPQDHLLIIPPKHPHVAADPHSDSYRFAVLSFSLKKIEGEHGFYDYFEQTLLGRSLSPVRFSASVGRRLSELMRSYQMEGMKGACYRKSQACALIFELFDGLNGFYSPTSPRKNDTENDRLILLDALVSQSERSLSQIAAAINYSPRHTARLIRQIYGCSLSELRRNH